MNLYQDFDISPEARAERDKERKTCTNLQRLIELDKLKPVDDHFSQIKLNIDDEVLKAITIAHFILE